MKIVSRYDHRRKTKFNDMCEDNDCRMWVVAVFDKLPAYVKKNTPKKWIKPISNLYNYIDPDTATKIHEEIEKKKIKNPILIISEFIFSWTDDPKKHIKDQIYGMNISGWLTKNGNNKNLIYAEAWNKVD